MSMQTMDDSVAGRAGKRVVVHLAASPFFGGPERQMLGLARNLSERVQSIFLSFPERGLARPFLDQLRQNGFVATALEHNTPHFAAAITEIADHLRQHHADVLLCHGYKADLLGYLAARRVGIPVVGVSRGWTAATTRVRFYEMLDRRVLRYMDQVVCVSQGQADKVARCGVSASRLAVIRNAIDTGRFDHIDPSYRQKLTALFAKPPRRIIGASGRLSPEKGFAKLVEAAQIVVGAEPSTGFVLFGDGPLRADLQRQIELLHLRDHFVLAGFRPDAECFMAQADVVALPSFTEGLPNVALEASAARVAVVATAVGGTPEVVRDGENGFLVPAGQSSAMAGRILDLLRDAPLALRMGQRGRERVERHFTFIAQSLAYQRLFDRLTAQSCGIQKQTEVEDVVTGSFGGDSHLSRGREPAHSHPTHS